MAAQLRVLLVEDLEDCALTTAQLLRLYGHDVEIAGNGSDALRMVKAYDPHVVALDLGLPGMDGYEVAKRIKQRANGKTPTMIAISGHGTQEDRRKSAEAGIAVHLVKPVDPQELKAVFKGLKEIAIQPSQ
jgi:two-component system OmpR family response regulator